MNAERREVLLNRFRQHQQRLIGAQPYFKIEAVRKMRFLEQRARLRRIVIVALQISDRSRAGSVACTPRATTPRPFNIAISLWRSIA